MLKIMSFMLLKGYKMFQNLQSKANFYFRAGG